VTPNIMTSRNFVLARCRFIVAIIVVATGMSVLTARLTAQPGTITGRVVDTAGQRMPGVTITATPERGGLSRRTTSSGDGTFRFEGLAEAVYRLDFELTGFGRSRRNHVRLGQESDGGVEAVLFVRSVCECVTIAMPSEPRTLAG
jgi:Carboxypeptidase regulatory-like domain